MLDLHARHFCAMRYRRKRKSGCVPGGPATATPLFTPDEHSPEPKPKVARGIACGLWPRRHTFPLTGGKDVGLLLGKLRKGVWSSRSSSRYLYENVVVTEDQKFSDLLVFLVF
jgi:hypothetical protein